jgi:hemoglobin/transferrin/lactoferrin receptor protein
VYFLYQGEIRSERLAIEERAKREIYAQDAQGLSYAPAWQTLNLKFSYAVTSWASVQAGVENMLDRRYRPYSSGISAAGRNLTLSLRATL